MTKVGKVFLSHASGDKPFVDRLASDLAKHSIPVWYDKFDLRIGESVPGKINQGIADAQYFAIVLSPAAISSKWVIEELNAGLMKQVANDGTFLLPILLEDCAIPPLLAHRKYVDFRNGYDEALNELLSLWGKDKAACEIAGKDSVLAWPDIRMSDSEFVYVHSTRFDKFFRMSCSLSWTVDQTIDYLTETLSLPWNQENPTLGMKWSFSYGIRLNGNGLSLRDTLAGAGINLGDVLQISISGTYEDLYEKELKEMWAGDKMYMMTTQMLQRREWLQAQVAARKRMTRDDLKKIADSCFVHVDS
ncbi:MULTISPECIES: toll/interleukin-1 receptor domain-containing protein [Pseudomonas]|uniref:toll/interleukin-1 receptor domain-containing protein n=1 Tax=Pseudomonas TaxID=286 RepID=UPI000A22A181|nr:MULTISPECIES: toll/interleukin-1 receptor domain-containing protein [Pseudomonas]MBL3607112.1 toll/interleukin-1 receptor domain-containing protein [Pseudomonas syringae pv. actinidiae]OSR65565.1 hypothetical protein BV327_05325 [Pseudomonas syringae pv. actinidiae]OSS23759.1 hypothetical protein BV337_05226 [Pseudomonas syringae pv. actinidiae]PHN30693.1 hypothetical protein AO240_18465 [Pseudomonas sp. ICMP 460]